MAMTMFDSIEVSTIPGFANSPNFAVAGYVAGSWPDFSEEVRAFPLAKHISIAIAPGERAKAGDCERGDMSPWQLAQFLKGELDGGNPDPWGYGAASDVQSIIDAAAQNGIDRSKYMIWSAHVGRGEHICAPDVCGYPRADGTQWTFTALNRNLDQSLCGDQMFRNSPVPVVNKMHYERFVALDGERINVEKYDKLRPQWQQHHTRLVELRSYFLWLCGNIYWRAIDDAKHTGKVDWAKDNRGWRWHQLYRRGKYAQRFV